MNFRDCFVHDWGYSNFNLNLNIKLSHSFKTPIILFKRNYLKQNCCKKAMHENKNRTFQEVRSRELLDNFRGPFHAYAQQKKLPPIFFFYFNFLTSLYYLGPVIAFLEALQISVKKLFGPISFAHSKKKYIRNLVVRWLDLF